MKIGINISYGVMEKPTGVGNYILNLVKYLLKVDKQNNYIMYYRYNKINKKRFLNFNIPNKFFEPRLTFFNMFDGIDIFHDPSFKYVKIPGAKTVITVHDVVVALKNENFSSEHFKKYNFPKLKKAINKADRIITVSNFSKREILKYFKINENKIDVIYSGVEIEKFRNATDNVLNLPEKYFLFVGNIEFRKNIINIVKAFINFQKKNKDYFLILIGKNGYGGELIREFIEKQSNKNIIQVNYVENNKLGTYYKNAVAFLYPSFYEGFGLPILEAMASRCIVLTSNNDNATVEAGGTAAIYANPYDIYDIEKKINIIKNMSKEEKENIIEKGIKHIKNFKWETTAEKTLETYKKCF